MCDSVIHNTLSIQGVGMDTTRLAQLIGELADDPRAGGGRIRYRSGVSAC